MKINSSFFAYLLLIILTPCLCLEGKYYAYDDHGNLHPTDPERDIQSIIDDFDNSNPNHPDDRFYLRIYHRIKGVLLGQPNHIGDLQEFILREGNSNKRYQYVAEAFVRMQSISAEDKAEWIEANIDKIPSYWFAALAAITSEYDAKESIFWLNVAELIMRLDALRCKDKSVVNVPDTILSAFKTSTLKDAEKEVPQEEQMKLRKKAYRWVIDHRKERTALNPYYIAQEAMSMIMNPAVRKTASDQEFFISDEKWYPLVKTALKKEEDDLKQRNKENSNNSRDKKEL